jgi:hypothetical protein
MSNLFDNPKPLFVDDEENPDAGAAVTGVTTYHSTRLDTLGGSHSAIHILWTGTPTGTVLIQSSNDNPADKTTQDWVDEPGINIPVEPTGSAVSTMVHVFHNGARWLRVQYDNTAGSGAIRALANVKV